MYKIHAIQTKIIDTTFGREEGPGGLVNGLNRICEEARQAAENNYQMIVLSDQLAGPDR